MDHVTRLQLIGRVTYYLGWLAAICGGLVHFGIFMRTLGTINLLKRNLFEAAVMFFLICMASELRALVLSGSSASPAPKKQAA